MLMVKPHGIFCAHWWNEIGHLLNIIQDSEVKLFVEIGILDGGLTSLLIDQMSFNPGLQYIGVNLGLHYTDPRVMKKAGEIMPFGFCALLDVDAWDEKTASQIRRCISNKPGRAMIYCDGGDKTREAHLYWPVLRPGDLLGVHDYSDDPESVGPEVYFSDVSDIIAAGRRLGQDDLKETRILLVEKI